MNRLYRNRFFLGQEETEIAPGVTTVVPEATPEVVPEEVTPPVPVSPIIDKAKMFTYFFIGAVLLVSVPTILRSLKRVTR
jgi:hypothetical protein